MNKVLDLDELYLRKKYPVMQLVRPRGGIVNSVARVIGDEVSPEFSMANSNLGNLTPIFSHVRSVDGSDASSESIGGSGADRGSEMAWLRAAMEGVERYASMAYDESEFLIASGNELGKSALDLDCIPRCSAKEYATSHCPYAPADKSQPIRWVKGYSLIDRKEVFLPALMTHLYLQPTSSERFWQMISTGVAAHVSLQAALNSAICEVIERDAIALTWLLRLKLPEITLPAVLPAALAPNFETLRRSNVQHRCFDATTDLGVATVYALQTLSGHPHLSQYVNCATEFDAVDAYAKTIREAAPARPVFNDGYEHPQNIEDFTALHDGASFLGKPENRHAFDFLTKSSPHIDLSNVGDKFVGNEPQRLKALLKKLSDLGMNAYAVDLTPVDIREAGVWVVKVIIPQLMPMVSTHSGRFLGHPRLYEYPLKAGFGAINESDINPDPQPFA